LGQYTVDNELRATTASATRTTRTRPALLGALLTLLEEKPFEQITVREITARADVGYATFFRRYPDKETLLHDLAAQEISNLLAMTLPILHRVDSRASTQLLCAYVWEHRKLWSALLTGGAAATLKDEFIRQAQEKAAEQPNPHSWLPGDLNVVFSVAASIEVLAWWLKQDAPAPPNQMAEIIDRLIVIPSIAQVDELPG
jgi:AcrR family transcriptional regulator